MSAQRGQFSEPGVCSWINPFEVLTKVKTLVGAFCPKVNVLLYWPQCDSLSYFELYLVTLLVLMHSCFVLTVNFSMNNCSGSIEILTG